MSPPPGYVAYGGPGAYPRDFQRIGGLTKALVILNIISIAATAISLVVQLTLRNKALDFREGATTLDEFADELAPYLAISAILGLVALGALVVLIIWTFRMAKNLEVLGRRSRKFSPGATIAVNILGGCTLGILPYFMWRELWKGSDPEVPPGDADWTRRPIGQIVHLWFAATILTFAVTLGLGVGNAVTRVNRGSDTTLAKQLDDQFAFIIISGLLTIVTAVLFLGLIRSLAARHMQATHEA
jgi:hypothetical protein